MKNLKDNHNLYNQVDVLLLTDVFENFRDICIKNYNLDPAHYYTALGLAWDAALTVTKVELELLSDMDMLVGSELSKYIAYLDANNLYGWAMSKPPPRHGFEWMKKSELETWELHSCILEVDLEYPKSLHDLHNDYPLAPERIEVNKIKKNLFPI